MKELGEGIAWMGFWIGLGLYNFQGCTPQIKTGIEIYRQAKPPEKDGSVALGSFAIRKKN